MQSTFLQEIYVFRLDRLDQAYIEIEDLPITASDPPTVRYSISDHLYSLRHITKMIGKKLANSNLSNPIRATLLSPRHPDLFMQKRAVHLMVLYLVVDP